MSEQNPKTVHITNYYHKDSGGISTSFNNLMAAAERRERLVRLIVPGAAEAVEDVNRYARIYYVPARSSPIIDRRYRVIMPWQYMVKDTLIRKILLAERPDLVEVTDKYTLSLLGPMIRKKGFQQLGRPALVHFSAERMDDNIRSFLTRGKLGGKLARLVVGNYLLPIFDFHIANSGYTAQEFVDALSIKNPRGLSTRFRAWCWRYFAAPRVDCRERIFVTPRGVDAGFFTPERRSTAARAEMAARAGIPASSVILLYAGRISPEKNIKLLLDMMENLAGANDHDYRLLVAGAGPQTEWLRQAAKKRVPGRIIQLGHLEKELLADYYANVDAFVHPNPREPFGIAPLEGMASGTATVAPNTGGVLTYATNDNAWLAEPTGSAFAEAIREIVGNADLRNAKEAAAVRTARENTREHATDLLFATYDKIYADFQQRLELFTDIEAAQNFDFQREMFFAEGGDAEPAVR